MNAGRCMTTMRKEPREARAQAPVVAVLETTLRVSHAYRARSRG